MMDYFSSLNLRSDLATEVENLNILFSDLKLILSSPACLSGLEMCGNTVCTLK